MFWKRKGIFFIFMHIWKCVIKSESRWEFQIVWLQCAFLRRTGHPCSVMDQTDHYGSNRPTWLDSPKVHMTWIFIFVLLLCVDDELLYLRLWHWFLIPVNNWVIFKEGNSPSLEKKDYRHEVCMVFFSCKKNHNKLLSKRMNRFVRIYDEISSFYQNEDM